MRVVLRHPLPLGKMTSEIKTGRNPKVVHCGAKFPEDNWPTLWIEQDDPNLSLNENLSVTVMPTGEGFDTLQTHVGSFVSAGGDYVWHVYADVR